MREDHVTSDNLRENNVTSDFLLVGNLTEPANVITVGNNTIQSITGNVVLHNVPHKLENIPAGYEFNNFVMNSALAENFLHGQVYAEESNSRNTNADNIGQNDNNTSETEIVNSLQEDYNLNNFNTVTATANTADANDDDDFDDVDYDDEPSSSETDNEFGDDNSDFDSDDSETDDEFGDGNSDFDSDDSDFHDLVEVHFIIIVLW